MDEAVAPVSTPVRGGRRSAVPPLEVIGLALAVVVFWCAGTSFAMQVPPFYGTDERAHLGYAHAVAGGDLPEIDDQPRVPGEADRWRQELAEDSKSDRYRTIWVANHPPLHYVLVAPLVWLARAIDHDDGGLRYLRFANLAFASVGLVFTYLLTVEVSGSRPAGLATASLLAVLPRGHYEFAEALNDGLGFAAATAVAWAAVRAMRRPRDRAALAVLAAAVAVAAGARAASMLVGARRRRCGRLVAVGDHHGVGAAAGGVGDHHGRRRRGAGGAAVRLVLRTQRRRVRRRRSVHYLMDWFGRRPTGGVIEVLLDGGMWLDIYQALATRSLLSIPATGQATFVADVAALVVVAGLVAVAVRRPRRMVPRTRHGPGRPDHLRRGGRRHGCHDRPARRRRRSAIVTVRAVGVLACLFVIGAEVVAALVLPVVVVAVLVTWTGHVVPGRVAAEVDRGRGPGPVDLAAGVDTALLAVSVASTLALVAVLATTACCARPDRASADVEATWRRGPWTAHDASVPESRQAAPPEGTSAHICQSRSDAGAEGLDGFQPDGTVGGAPMTST